MTSDAKRAANQRNARNSTGPRTATGKAASSRNSLRHGLLARETCLPDEDPREFARLREQLFAALDPDGVFEEACCDRIADSIWRLRRAGRIERDIFAFRMHASTHEQVAVATEIMLAIQKLPADSDEERKLRAARAREQLAEQKLQLEDTALGLAFSKDSGGPNALGKLGRYESAIERTLARNLERLASLRAARGDRGSTGSRAQNLEVEDHD
jgi:hypothetical protein